MAHDCVEEGRDDRLPGIAVQASGEQTSTNSASPVRQPLLSRHSEAWWRRAARRQHEAVMVHLFGGTVIAEHPLRGKVMLVGRDPGKALVLLSSRASRHHARLFQHRGAWVMVDTGSRHGICLNGVQVHSVSLREGDFLQLGDDILTYTLR
jgi:hypothetical protein